MFWQTLDTLCHKPLFSRKIVVGVLGKGMPLFGTVDIVTQINTFTAQVQTCLRHCVMQNIFFDNVCAHAHTRPTDFSQYHVVKWYFWGGVLGPNGPSMPTTLGRWKSATRSPRDDDCFYYHSWRNNVVIAFGTLSSFLT